MKDITIVMDDGSSVQFFKVDMNIEKMHKNLNKQWWFIEDEETHTIMMIPIRKVKYIKMNDHVEAQKVP